MDLDLPYLLGQLRDTVDLDGPIFLSVDRSPPVEYTNGTIRCPEALWGTPE
jgi:L-Ala-D/L-Glu epimerase